MKHLWIKKEPYEGTLHTIVGFYHQDMSDSLSSFHANGDDLVDITQEELEARRDDFAGIDIYCRRENMWVYDSSVPDVIQVANPEWPYPEEV